MIIVDLLSTWSALFVIIFNHGYNATKSYFLMNGTIEAKVLVIEMKIYKICEVFFSFFAVYRNTCNAGHSYLLIRLVIWPYQMAEVPQNKKLISQFLKAEKIHSTTFILSAIKKSY